MALFTFKLPDIGEGIAQAEIVGWHVKVGDRVEEDQPIADMMTDKATVEMESPVAGTVVRLAGEPGDQISIGAMLVEIEMDGEAAATPPPSVETIEAEVPGDAVVAEAAETPLPIREGPGVGGERKRAQHAKAGWPEVGADAQQTLPAAVLFDQRTHVEP